LRESIVLTAGSDWHRRQRANIEPDPNAEGGKEDQHPDQNPQAQRALVLPLREPSLDRGPGPHRLG